MSADDPLLTSAAMLEELKGPNSQEAFARFVNRYGQRICEWCRKRGLRLADAEDMTQEVLLKRSR